MDMLAPGKPFHLTQALQSFSNIDKKDQVERMQFKYTRKK